MFEIVDHEQLLPIANRCDGVSQADRGGICSRNAQRARNRRQDIVGLGHRSELYVPRAVLKLGHQLSGHTDSQSALATAARSSEGDEARPAALQPLARQAQLFLAANKLREMNRDTASFRT